ncbi:MAG: MFS transporter [Actinomycetota bacterium]|nr:MFS transporter [Actinomycetota bacterium]
MSERVPAGPLDAAGALRERADDARATASIGRRVVAVFAVLVGVSIANLYYVQPLLPMVRRDFHVATGVAALATTAAQLGFVLGLLFVLPLGDLVERRRLVSGLALGCAVALLAAGSAPDIAVLLVALVLVGATVALAQVLIPLAATLAAEHERGRVVGLVMSGLLLGILLARTFAGLVAAASSWRVVFYSAAGSMIVVTVLAWVRVPRDSRRTEFSYGQLLGSLRSIVRSEPVLRRRATFGALGMGCFSVLWTSIAFLLSGPPYHYSAARIGLFGLVGAAGALMATAAGRLADQGRSHMVTVAMAVLLAGSYLPIYLGARSLAGLVVGIVVLDVGVQGLHITNQSLIYRLAPEHRSRTNSVYMVSYFLGGTSASGIAAALYPSTGWAGVCALGASLGAVATAVALADLRSARRAASPSRQVRGAS